MQGMVRVTVKLVGAAAEAAGAPALEYGLVPGSALRSLVAMLCARHPGLLELSSGLWFAVNGERCELDAVLAEGDEIRVIPSFH